MFATFFSLARRWAVHVHTERVDSIQGLSLTLTSGTSYLGGENQNFRKAHIYKLERF